MTDTNCPDCGVPVGTAHVDVCDVARCHATGEQRLSHTFVDVKADHDCGKDVWTGEWPYPVD